MLNLYDVVIYKPDGHRYIIVNIDTDNDTKPPIYGLEREDMYEEDWFRWAEEDEVVFFE